MLKIKEVNELIDLKLSTTKSKSYNTEKQTSLTEKSNKGSNSIHAQCHYILREYYYCLDWIFGYILHFVMIKSKSHAIHLHISTILNNGSEHLYQDWTELSCTFMSILNSSDTKDARTNQSVALHLSFRRLLDLPFPTRPGLSHRESRNLSICNTSITLR